MNLKEIRASLTKMLFKLEEVTAEDGSVLLFDGEVIVDHLAPKRLLDTLRLACKGKTKPLAELCRQLNKETDNGRDMSAYTDLLHLAIESIVNVKEESDIASLFTDGESSFLRNEIAGLDDFELITFVIVK